MSDFKKQVDNLVFVAVFVGFVMGIIGGFFIWGA